MSNELIGIIEPKLEIVAQIIGTGARGEKGDIGYINGDPLFYEFVQMLPSNEWIINHSLNKYPSVTVVDSAGTVVIGNVRYIDKSVIKITFSAAFSGKAFLN